MEKLRDIECIPTEDLLAELFKRNCPAVFIATCYEGETTDRKWQTWYKYNGNVHSVRGLLKEMDSTLEEIILKHNLEKDDE